MIQRFWYGCWDTVTSPKTNMFAHRVNLLVIFLLVFGFQNGSADEDQEAFNSRYQNQVLPLLKQYCSDCHGPEKQKSGVRVDKLDLDFIQGQDRETWHDILDVLNRGEMPPEDELQPSDHDRQVMVDWMTAEMIRSAKVRRSTGGHGVLRRLTRYEYNNTMADLLGIPLDYAKNLPPEPINEDGFKNNSMAMGMSGMQLEYYLKSAQMGLELALVESDEPKRFELTNSVNVSRRHKQKLEKPHTRNIQPGNCFMTRLLEYPDSGPVTIRVRAHAKTPEGKGPPRMRVMIGLRADTYVPGGQIGEDVDVTARESEPGIYEFRGWLDNLEVLKTPSNFPGMLVNVHNVHDDGSDAIELLDLKVNQQEKRLNKPDPKQPWLVVESVEFVGPDYQTWPPGHHQNILYLGSEIPDDERGYAREVLKRFMRRAYRRPAAEGEVEDVLGFYDKIRPEYSSFIQTIRHALSMVLISPQFLYLVEPIEAENGARKLTAHEVASRLSYFLWSTMPDETLFELADEQALLQPTILKAQVDRMLKDPRADRFVDQFTEQWLDLSALDRVAVNPQFYPDFKDRVKKAMRQETQAFFAEVLHGHQSAMDFLDSDWTMLNERLAKHYGVEGVTGTLMRKVTLKPEHRRGGLITQGSMLLGNSTGEDSHPINRAVWILKRLLDDAPPPPPANVPALDSETPGFDQLTLKEQLAIHRGVPSCTSCHQRIDPWGIPLEHYDATGLLRDQALRLTANKKGQARNKVSKAPLDASDVMPDGTVVEGVDGLKRYLLKNKKDDFSRALVSKVTTYALGRSLEFTDESTIDSLTDQFARQGYRLDRLIQSIVKSDLFLTR